jgi:hypothetical protein
MTQVTDNGRALPTNTLLTWTGPGGTLQSTGGGVLHGDLHIEGTTRGAVLQGMYTDGTGILIGAIADDWSQINCGPNGLAFGNRANTVRIGTLDNSGHLTLNGRAAFTGGVVYFGAWGAGQHIASIGSGLHYRGVNHHFGTPDGLTYAPIYAASFNVSSAATGKRDIRPLENPIDVVLDDRLHGIRYVDVTSRETEVGFVADPWAEVVPEVVARDQDNEIIAMDYSRVGAVTFEALKAFVIETRSRLDALEGKP